MIKAKYMDILPIIIMTEMFLASIPYAMAGRWGSAIYWFSGGLLNCAVIFMIKRLG